MTTNQFFNLKTMKIGSNKGRVFSLACKLTILIFLTQMTTQSCIPTQEALTFGERYINSKSTCEYTFSFVSKDACQTANLQFFILTKDGQEKKVLLQDSKDYTFKDPKAAGGVDYKASSYFYCIEREDVVRFITKDNELTFKIVADNKNYPFKFVRRVDLGDFKSLPAKNTD